MNSGNDGSSIIGYLNGLTVRLGTSLNGVVYDQVIDPLSHVTIVGGVSCIKERPLQRIGGRFQNTVHVIDVACRVGQDYIDIGAADHRDII